LFNFLDSATVTNSAVTRNTASLAGGGISNDAGTTTLNNSSVTNNTALSSQAGSIGGGIFTFSGTVPLNHSLVSHNTPDNCDPADAVPGCAG
jgi:hypothetical protein